jgi:TPR repeat protein
MRVVRCSNELKDAEEGDTCSQCRVGERYEEDCKAFEEAVKWYRKEAEQDHAGAQCYLGNCYYDGIGG